MIEETSLSEHESKMPISYAIKTTKIREAVRRLKEEDFETAIKRFEESANKNCSKGDGCYICDSCKLQLIRRLVYYLKRRMGEKLT